YILIIISSTHTESIKKILEREKVSEYFTEILGVDVEKNKIIKTNLVLEKYKILSKDAVFITDTLGDIREASKCGVQSIGVTWGYHEKETLEKGNPVAIINNPIDLINNIQNILK
ncbi:MAG: HAD hydrolase-like protein, partial [bacterium]